MESRPGWTYCIILCGWITNCYTFSDLEAHHIYCCLTACGSKLQTGSTEFTSQNLSKLKSKCWPACPLSWRLWGRTHLQVSSGCWPNSAPVVVGLRSQLPLWPPVRAGLHSYRLPTSLHLQTGILNNPLNFHFRHQPEDTLLLKELLD